jgi:hypothetical protein
MEAGLYLQRADTRRQPGLAVPLNYACTTISAAAGWLLRRTVKGGRTAEVEGAVVAYIVLFTILEARTQRDRW